MIAFMPRRRQTSCARGVCLFLNISAAISVYRYAFTRVLLDASCMRSRISNSSPPLRYSIVLGERASGASLEARCFYEGNCIDHCYSFRFHVRSCKRRCTGAINSRSLFDERCRKMKVQIKYVVPRKFTSRIVPRLHMRGPLIGLLSISVFKEPIYMRVDRLTNSDVKC
jgi:hypothetical protein